MEKKPKTCTSYLTKFWIDLDGIWSLMRHVGMTNLIFILSCLVKVQGRQFYLFGFLKKLNIGMYLDIYGLISFKLGLMRMNYILISVWMILTIIQGHSCMRNQELLHLFAWNRFGWNVVCCHNILKIILNLFCLCSIQGRKLVLGLSFFFYIKYTFNSGLCWGIPLRVAYVGAYMDQFLSKFVWC